MADDTATALRLIETLDGPYDAAAHNLLHRFCVGVKAAADQKGLGALAQILPRLKAGAKTQNLSKRILLTSTLAEVTGEAAWYDAVFKDAMSDGLGFETRHALMMHLGIAMFDNRARLDDAEHARLEQESLRALFGKVVADADAFLAASSFAAAPAETVKDRVVILTPQFLAPPHATTVRAMEYAQCLIEDFGKTPVIVEAHTFPQSSPVAFVPPFASNRNAQVKPIDRVAVAGHSVEFYQIASPYFGLRDLAGTAATLSALSPELVIAISGQFVPAEAAALRFPTFLQPTIASMPISARAKTFSWNPATEDQLAVLERFGVRENYLFDMHPGFSAPATQGGKTRGDFGLSNGDFVFAVIGNRLDTEIDARFLELLETITADPRAHVVMMGRFERFDDMVGSRRKLSSQVSYIGFQNDVLAVLELCDACLNPDRTGGGRSGAYAQHAGLPVLSLKRGDVASTIGIERCYETYADIAAAAKRLMDDPDWLAEQSEDARARAGETIGVKRLIARILDEMGVG